MAGATLAPPVQEIDGLTFFGFISSTPFTLLRFIGAGIPEGDGFALDDLLFGDPPRPAPPRPAPPGPGPAGVPEPASWALMVIGFGGLGVMLRGRRATSGASTTPPIK